MRELPRIELGTVQADKEGERADKEAQGSPANQINIEAGEGRKLKNIRISGVAALLVAGMAAVLIAAIWVGNTAGIVIASVCGAYFLARELFAFLIRVVECAVGRQDD